MPKAEVGSTKYLNNKLKSKGLQRLRWSASGSLLCVLYLLTLVQVLSGKLPVHGSQSLVLRDVQICEKQCRDENGFKCHTQAESHVRNALLVGEARFLGPNGKLLRSLTQPHRTLENTFQTFPINSRKTSCNYFVRVTWRKPCK